MKFHLTLRSRRTTITIDEELTRFLMVKLDGLHEQLGSVKGVRRWIQKTVRREAASVPEKNVSQWVQSRILREVVDPALRARRSEMEIGWQTMKDMKAKMKDQPLTTLPEVPEACRK